MHIPSDKTRQDMEAAAELRAAGATWETIGERLGRKPFVMRRWRGVYADEWGQFERAAEIRQSRRGTEERARMWQLLRCDNARVRLAAAQEVLRRLSAEPPISPNMTVAGLMALVESISDEVLEEYIAKFMSATGVERNGAAL